MIKFNIKNILDTLQAHYSNTMNKHCFVEGGGYSQIQKGKGKIDRTIAYGAWRRIEALYTAIDNRTYGTRNHTVRFSKEELLIDIGKLLKYFSLQFGFLPGNEHTTYNKDIVGKNENLALNYGDFISIVAALELINNGEETLLKIISD